MNFWEKIKKDVQKGVKEGIHIVKEGATTVREKAEELTEEGKRRYKIFDLKTKVQREIAELGGKVYELSPKRKNPLLEGKVKAIIARIKKLESQILKLEGKLKTTVKKKTAKPAVREKKK
ncbi:MAG: hypothetical protein AB1632_10075 [Nitrospirota bacterium]